MGISLLNRAQGVLYGQVIGDSLGALVEFQSPQGIRLHYPDGVRELEDGGIHGIAAGQPTDDSEMALALARSLVRQGGYNEEDVLDSYRRWVHSGAFDVGTTIGPALTRGVFNEASQANGALMRIAPLALAYAHDVEQAMEFARVDAALTHPHPLCADANGWFIGALVDVLNGEDAFAAFRRRSGLELSGWRERDYFDKMGWLWHALHALYGELADAAARQSDAPEGTGGVDFEESLVRVIGYGGDSDTNAAIVGAFLGGVVGASGIPQRWRDVVDACVPLRNRPEEYHPNDVAVLAEQLLALA